MKDVLEVAAQWALTGASFVMATVVGISGSAPRELGATMLIGADGTLIGNVSGGCVESAVVEEAVDALATGGSVVCRYGISDDAVFGIGLTCGGIIDVLVRPILPGTSAAQQLCTLALSEEPMALALTVAGEELGTAHLVLPGEESGPLADAAALAFDDEASLLSFDAQGCRTESDPSTSMLVIPFGAPPRLIVVGAVAFASALARLGAVLGYRVSVVDARTAFTVAERFPGADVVDEWPDRYLARTPIDARTAIVVLSHDEKFDVPALREALASPAGYVGAMGSRRTHADRLQRLAEAGVPASRIARLRSPLGLDLGGRTPEETALSILAEIVAVRHGATGAPLSQLDGPIHAPSSSPRTEARRWVPPDARDSAVCAPFPTVAAG